MRVFLDANVLFSAAKSDGAVRELLRRLHAAGHELYADAYVVAEAHRNLELKATGGIAALEALLSNVEVAMFESATLPAEISTRLPDKDRPVLAGAIRLRCDVLVTGDRTHFGELYGRQPRRTRDSQPTIVGRCLVAQTVILPRALQKLLRGIEGRRCRSARLPASARIDASRPPPQVRRCAVRE
jgi:predicted nucleic acid-binding protein